jgi:hypothetical protein
MKSNLLNLLALLSMVAPLAANAMSITYDVDRMVGDGSVVGTITTDGTLGVLTSGNITDWVITLSAPNLRGGSPDVIDFATQTQTNLGGTATTATATQLLFDFTLSGTNFFLLVGGSGNFWCLETANCTGDGFGEHMGRNSLEFIFSAQSETFTPGNLVFAEAAAVPVPAAVWLFGSALGLLTWMRRQKSA